MAAIAWFVLGAGIFFGAGAALWALLPDLSRTSAFAEENVGSDLARVNLLNSASVLIVLLSSYPVASGREPRTKKSMISFVDWYPYYRVLYPLVALTVLVQFAFFPVPQDLLIRTLIAKISVLVPVFFLLTGVLWPRLSILERATVMPLLAAQVAYAALTFSKLALMAPILTLLAGIWITRSSVRWVAISSAFVLVLYFLLVAPTVGQSRGHREYDAERNSIGERAMILMQALSESPRETKSSLSLLGRFAHAPVQAFLIEEYLKSRPGTTLRDFWAALVPRVIWPEKPVITRFGPELHGLYWNQKNPSSALAPTYSAEAYWNYGVWGCLVVSLIFGLELGWLTRRWFLTIEGRDDSFLLVAFPAAFMALNVESWIAASLAGGFVTLLILWLGLRFLLKRTRPGGEASRRHPPGA